jgi:hypothetical protein
LQAAILKKNIANCWRHAVLDAQKTKGKSEYSGNNLLKKNIQETKAVLNTTV